MPKSTANARRPLTTERILRSGVELADEQGLGGLSMRRLAAHLGFEVMSLYNHVAHKRELLEGMLELIAAEVELPDPDLLHWKAGLLQLATAQHRMLLRHRWAGPISTDHFPGPYRWRIADRTLRLLAGGGIDGDLRDIGYHAITLHISGFTAQQIAYDFTDEFVEEMDARVEREFDREQHPWMAEHIDYHRHRETTATRRPDQFRFVLDLILDGLERARDAGVLTSTVPDPHRR